MRVLLSTFAIALISLLGLGQGQVARAAPIGFLSSNTTGAVSCNDAGDCGTLVLTPASDGYQYWYQASCITTSTFTTVGNCDWGAFNPSYSNCDFGNATWGTPCTMNIEESGLPAGTYSPGLYVDYLYCPSSQFNAANGSCSNYYETVQTVMAASSTSPSSGTQSSGSGGGSPSPSPVKVPAPDALSLLALALLGAFGLRRRGSGLTPLLSS